MDRIEPWLYIGGKSSAVALAHNGVKYCINISGIPSECADVTLKVGDRGHNNDPQQFIVILKEIDKARKANNVPLMLMCHAGVSRSPAVAALYLFYNHEFKSFDAALDYVRQKSSLARPNPNLLDFIKQRVVPLMAI